MEDKELVQIFLDADEWTAFECKRAAIEPSKLLETVTSFANTEGGYIVVGLEDPAKAERNKRLIGIGENLDNIAEFLKLVQKEIDPPLNLWGKFELDIVNVAGKPDKLFIVNVKKSNDVHSLRKGDTFVRKGWQNVKIGSTEITRLKYEKGSIKFEDEKSEVVTLEDLDRTLLDLYKRDTSSVVSDDWQFLKDNGLAENHDGKFKLTKAGVLLFGRNPSVSMKSKCGIKISHYYGTKPSYTGEPNFVARPFTIEGPLFRQIEQVVDYFKGVVKKSPPKLVGASFRPTLLIPEWAFQEAITNAVIHRNYFVQNDVQVRFFDDRIEIESPGTYPGHITPGNIRSERFARNPIILRTLNRFQLAPNLDIGEGVDRMFKVMQEQDLYEPLFSPPASKPNSVLLVLLNLQKVEYWDIVSKYLDENYRITNRQARGITGIEDTIRMSRFLRLWVAKELLEKVDSKFKGNIYYKKFGVTIPKKLDRAFAGGGINGR